MVRLYDGLSPAGVLGAHVVDGPDGPQLHRLLLARLQEREERLEGAVGHHLLAGVGPVRHHGPELRRDNRLGRPLHQPALRPVARQVGHDTGSEVGNLALPVRKSVR